MNFVPIPKNASMAVRDDCLPLAKELSMAFKKRATGGLKAVATLTAEQRAAMQASDKGEVQVAVTVTDEATRKTGVWEVWSRQHDLVVWVTEGAQKTLDEGPPHLKLSGFFPCPRPAYGTLQRRSLVPVPDVVFYRDQLEEINDLTRRIHERKEIFLLNHCIPETVQHFM